MILYILEIKIIRSFYKLLNFYPTSEPFISGDTFKKLSTYQYKGGILRIHKPEIIFTSTNNLKELSKELESIKHFFILITHHSDDLVEKKFLSIVNNRKLIHWYAQNCTLRHKKISNIPIGLEDRWRHNNGIINDFIKLRKKKIIKIPRILCSFNIATNIKIRKPAYRKISKLITADCYSGNSRQYRKKLVNYMFVACPEGNGIDTHRFWEALYLNVIPIVVKNFLYSQFKNLPILELNKWEELSNYSENDLYFIYKKNKNNFKLIKYIWIDYWKKNIIKNFSRHAKGL